MTVLRDRDTRTDEFQRHANVVSTILAIGAMARLQTEDIVVETPLSPYEGKKLQDDVIVVPVLRAGLAMLTPIREFLPTVSVGFIGLERDEQTAIAREYYKKIPDIFSTHMAFVIDPMLATGGSMNDTLEAIKKGGAKRIVVVSIICARQGLEHVTKNHPDIPIITAAIDEELGENSYIVPGLGDFGDRYFGTEQLTD